jgi:hypothetical protein
MFACLRVFTSGRRHPHLAPEEKRAGPTIQLVRTRRAGGTRRAEGRGWPYIFSSGNIILARRWGAVNSGAPRLSVETRSAGTRSCRFR